MQSDRNGEWIDDDESYWEKCATRVHNPCHKFPTAQHSFDARRTSPPTTRQTLNSGDCWSQAEIWKMLRTTESNMRKIFQDLTCRSFTFNNFKFKAIQFHMGDFQLIYWTRFSSYVEQETSRLDVMMSESRRGAGKRYKSASWWFVSLRFDWNLWPSNLIFSLRFFFIACLVGEWRGFAESCVGANEYGRYFFFATIERLERLFLRCCRFLQRLYILIFLSRPLSIWKALFRSQ